ncbi:hypothetical protein Gpo141_00003189 [Globisporangium polare]
MRRNYGSLNLAALDLSTNNARATVDSNSFTGQESLTHELAHLDFHDECASAVGYPIEFFADDAYAHAEAPRCRKRSLSAFSLSAETRASSSASITSTCSTASISSDVSTGISIPVPSSPVKSSPQATTSSYYHPVQKQHNLAIDLPQRLVEQHHMELNALRCLSLNLMLSSSSPCGSGSGVGGIMTVPQPSTSVPKMSAFEFEISCQPQGDRVSAALLAGRRGSLPRNMIQSV